MAKKARLKKENETIYPLTIPEAVKDPQTNRHIGEIYATKNALADKENKKVFKEVELDNYTLTNSDVNNFLVFNSNNPITLYVPENLDKSIVFEGVQNGAGKITFSGVGLIEIESPDSSLETGGKDDVFKLTKKSENKYVLQKRNFATGGGGTGAVDSVNGFTGAVVLDADDINDANTTNKFTNQADIDRLANTSGTNTGDQDISGISTNASAISDLQDNKVDITTQGNIQATGATQEIQLDKSYDNTHVLTNTENFTLSATKQLGALNTLKIRTSIRPTVTGANEMESMTQHQGTLFQPTVTYTLIVWVAGDGVKWILRLR